MVFRAPLLNGTGYADESLSFFLAAQSQGIPMRTELLNGEVEGVVAPEDRRRVVDCYQTPFRREHAILYQATTADGFLTDGYRYHIGRTMFETDRLPPGWVPKCNAMDEVWVPSRFNMETFARAGVKASKLRWVPAGVETNRFRPGLSPLEIPGRRKTNFLSIFEWSHRKGWDVLLKGYIRQFHKDDDVSLTIKTSSRGQDVVGDILNLIEGELGNRVEETPPIILLEGFIANEQYPSLYASGDAFVLPTRGEGYGRPFLEAMACGKPVIGTRWSGQLDFMTDENSYLIDLESIVPVDQRMDFYFYAGHMWAEPSAEHLGELMARVVDRPDEAVRRAEQARQDMVSAWEWSLVGARFAGELQRAIER